MPLSHASFKEALSCFASGVAVVTTYNQQDKTQYGITISSFCSLSLDPPLVLFCIEEKASLYEHFVAAEQFSINILSKSQETLSRHFASHHPSFDTIPYTLDLNHCPLLDGAIAHISCIRHDVTPGGDHAIIVGRVVAATSSADTKRPLLYYQRQYHSL